MKNTKYILPALILIWNTVTIMSMYTQSSNMFRFIVVSLFLLICPGISLLQNIEFNDIYMEIALSVALSLCMALFVSIVMVYANVWSSSMGLFLLIVISVLGSSIRVFHLATRRITLLK